MGYSAGIKDAVVARKLRPRLNNPVCGCRARKLHSTTGYCLLNLSGRATLKPGHSAVNLCGIAGLRRRRPSGSLRQKARFSVCSIGCRSVATIRYAKCPAMGRHGYSSKRSEYLPGRPRPNRIVGKTSLMNGMLKKSKIEEKAHYKPKW